MLIVKSTKEEILAYLHRLSRDLFGSAYSLWFCFSVLYQGKNLSQQKKATRAPATEGACLNQLK